MNEKEMKKEVEETIDTKFDKEMDDINQQLDEDCILAFVGDVNTGKSSTLNLIFDEPVTGVGALPGETTSIKIIPYKENIIFADTPGLSDVVSEHSSETWEYFKKADAVLFFLNAAGTVLSDREKESFEKIKKEHKRIIIVLNKIDAAENVGELVSYIRSQIGSQYDIIPVSSKTKEGIESLEDAILELMKDKDFVIGRHLRAKGKAANRVINRTSIAAASIGASPIPGSDFVPLSAIQVRMLIKLSKIYGKKMTKTRAKSMILSTITGNIGRTIVRQLSKVIPGYGMVIGASVAGAMTLALGRSVKYMYEKDLDLDKELLTDLYHTNLKKEVKQQT
ncbi:50S ribosome-binding GTPase [Bacillus shivajii]|uniref:YcjF family protein n=1 Tax=Bacillus shivajii TaxID=1983719 RepID=UPI001CFA3D6B|nr:GTPase [Bacillus shivajii]UCZ51929.1 50S ribosome-binding GTPase [Bacillus shivajii]